MGRKSQREQERGNLQDVELELRTLKGSSGTWAGEADLG